MYRNIFYDFVDAEDYTEIIKQIIKKFRTSDEYMMWLHLYDRHACAATGFTKDSDGVEIQMHHYGMTIWDWVERILGAFIDHNPPLPINTFYICLILNELHMNNCISCVPLMHCVHNMIHADYDSTIARYPSILENINEGNIELADQIIHEYVEDLANKLNINSTLEERT